MRGLASDWRAGHASLFIRPNFTNPFKAFAYPCNKNYYQYMKIFCSKKDISKTFLKWGMFRSIRLENRLKSHLYYQYACYLPQVQIKINSVTTILLVYIRDLAKHGSSVSRFMWEVFSGSTGQMSSYLYASSSEQSLIEQLLSLTMEEEACKNSPQSRKSILLRATLYVWGLIHTRNRAKKLEQREFLKLSSLW